ncbi:MAG TPA: hypothetical protein VIK74_01175 [Parasegetibacter sp.]
MAVSPQGNLSVSSSGATYTYRTSGGGTIVIDLKNGTISLTHDDDATFKIEFWGDFPDVKNTVHHENFKGKHIKDREGSRRSVAFPDGAKITMVTNSESDLLLSISIYDGKESHHINATCGQLEHSSVDAVKAEELDEAEADGETAAIEKTNTGWMYVNVYQEATPGTKVHKRVNLAEGFFDSPNKVSDYYDDPRWGHT